MECTALLIGEHKTILRAVDVLGTMANRAEATRKMDRDDVDAILEILNLFANELHQGKEEGALFPVFTAACDKSEVDAVRHMVFEHDQDRSLIEGMQEALERANVGDFAHYARRLCDMLRNHIQKEDNLLFEMIDRTLNKDDDEKVLARFKAFDEDFKSHGLDRLLHRLRMLEWKYMSKAA